MYIRVSDTPYYIGATHTYLDGGPNGVVSIASSTPTTKFVAIPYVTRSGKKYSFMDALARVRSYLESGDMLSSAAVLSNMFVEIERVPDQDPHTTMMVTLVGNILCMVQHPPNEQERVYFYHLQLLPKDAYAYVDSVYVPCFFVWDPASAYGQAVNLNITEWRYLITGIGMGRFEAMISRMNMHSDDPYAEMSGCEAEEQAPAVRCKQQQKRQRQHTGQGTRDAVANRYPCVLCPCCVPSCLVLLTYV